MVVVFCHGGSAIGTAAADDKSTIIQGAAERSPLFGKLINSKPKKIRQMFFFISGKYKKCRFTSTCFEQNITQVAALNIDTLM